MVRLFCFSLFIPHLARYGLQLFWEAGPARPADAEKGRRAKQFQPIPPIGWILSPGGTGPLYMRINRIYMMVACV
jgi:hypothetical protein